jgi:alkanesulfonate monooxygenase SsuD/methylene tetrahydromethanopterin reductase-like flavin-dependent oxidoreductase (luciferase family)
VSARPRLGLTLPAFSDSPAALLDVARVAEDSGVDGVFTFDHLFRLDRDGRPRPALELMATLGALGAATSRLTIGPLVARASLRPAASLAAGFDSVDRIAPGRFVGSVGAGDLESVPEDSAFGTMPEDRIATLTDTLARVTGRGYPVWVGGRSAAVRRLAAARADGWNLWGGDVAGFADRVGRLRVELAAAGRERVPFTPSWGGLAVLAPTDDEAAAKWERLGSRPDVVWGGPPRLAAIARRFGAAGADWVIFGPLDPAAVGNAEVLGSVRDRLR